MNMSASAVGLCLATAMSVVNVLMDVFRKKALVDNDVVTVTFWVRIFAAIVYAFAFWFHIVRSPGPLLHSSGAILGLFGATWPPIIKFLLYLIVDTGLVAIAILHYFRALKVADISLAVPFTCFTPMLLIPTGYLFLHEIPNARQLLGVLFVVVGSVAMNREAFRNGWLGPIKAGLREKGSRYMMVVAVVLAITNPIDKVIVRMSDPMTFAFGYGIMLSIFFALMAATQKHSWTGALRRSPWLILIAGFLDGVVLLLQFSAYRYADVLITITIKRAGVILSVLTGWLIFREKNIKSRLVAATAMLWGVVLIYIPMERPVQLLGTLFIVALFVITSRMRWGLPGADIETANSLLVPDCIPASLSAINSVLGESAEGTASKSRPPDITVAPRVLNCALLGCGEIVHHSLDLLTDLGAARVNVCVDIVQSRAETAARHLSLHGYSGAVRVSRLLEAALADDVDIVMISTPNYLHRAHAVAALSRNKHIFLQKPIATTMEDGLAIVEAGRRFTPAIAGVYMSYLEQPVVHDLRAMAECGWFGKITQVHVKLMHSVGLSWSNEAIRGQRLWRGSLVETGGGAFIQHAVHHIRVLNWIMRERVTHVHGLAANRVCDGLEGEDSAVALMQFESGTYATINVSWCATGEELAIHGTDGSAVYQNNRWLTLRSVHGFEGLAFDYQPAGEMRIDCPPPEKRVLPHRFNQHLQFVQAVRDGTPPLVSLEEGLQDLEVVSAFYESVRLGCSVQID